VLAIWGGLVVVGFLLIGGLLGSALSSEGDVTSNPESKRAEELIDERLPQRDEVDEVVIVTADGGGVTDPAVRRQVRGLVEQLRRSGAVEGVFSYLDRGGQALVSEDGRATILPREGGACRHPIDSRASAGFVGRRSAPPVPDSSRSSTVDRRPDRSSGPHGCGLGPTKSREPIAGRGVAAT
jgi:hypothetical protein